MGKKMLVALMMESKFSGEGIHSLESDEDMMSAMVRELVECGRVGESADAVWADVKRERAQHMPSMLMVSQTEPREEGDPSLPLLSQEPLAASSPEPSHMSLWRLYPQAHVRRTFKGKTGEISWLPKVYL
jgi:hypothetical protein